MRGKDQIMSEKVDLVLIGYNMLKKKGDGQIMSESVNPIKRDKK